MKDYFKYLTVGELKQQIKDTMISAKQKLQNLQNSRKQTKPSQVNQRFNNYVKEIKCKQEQYDSLMDQTNQLDILLNRRRNKINQSIERYQKSQRSKTCEGYYGRGLEDSREDEGEEEMRGKKVKVSSFLSRNAESKVYHQKIKDKYSTEPNSQVNLTNPKMSHIKETRTKGRQHLLTECRTEGQASQNRPLKSITNVLNIRIDNINANKKLFSFAKDKDSIKAEANKHIKQYDENKMKCIQKKLKMETLPTETKTNNWASVPIRQAIKQQKQKKEKKEPTIEHKGCKRIKMRIRQNQCSSQIDWKVNKKIQNTKTMTLKYQYQNFLRNDLKLKLMGAHEHHSKMKRIKAK